MKAMILLALNYGFGPKDIHDLTWEHIDDERVILPRNKTGLALGQEVCVVQEGFFLFFSPKRYRLAGYLLLRQFQLLNPLLQSLILQLQLVIFFTKLLKLLGKLLNDFSRLVFAAQCPCPESYPQVLSDEYLQNSG